MSSEGDKNGKGIFDFADGGRYVGEWTDENGAHGYGICTLPNENGVFEGRWEAGSQQSGIFTWSSGQKYIGAWKDGMRHGLGKEVSCRYCIPAVIIITSRVKSNHLTGNSKLSNSARGQFK